jgi:phosphoglycolate phosphatase
MGYLIFDLDGTLVDSNATCVAILQEMLDERGAGVRLDQASASLHMSCGGTRMVAALLGDACGDPELELKDFRARYAVRHTPADALFDGVATGLQRLSEAGHKLAICSNKPQNLCDKVLDDTGLRSLFEAVVGGRPELRPKPNADLLEKVLGDLGTCRTNCVYIGDSEIDHTVARQVDMPFCFMSYGYASPGWEPEAAAVFDRFDSFVHTVLEEPLTLFRPH